MRRGRTHTAGTRIEALRAARTCYDHLAGRLGVAVLAGLVEHGALIAADAKAEADVADRPTAAVAGEPYVLGPEAVPVFDRLGIDLGGLVGRRGSNRPLLRFCVDWTERRYHLAGALGAAVLARAETERWLVRHPGDRAVDVTDAGRRALRDTLGIGRPAA